MAAVFSFSDGQFTFRAFNFGRFVLRSKSSGYEHEFDWSGEKGDDLVSMATLRHLGPCYTFTQAVKKAKAFMLNEREIEVHTAAANMIGESLALPPVTTKVVDASDLRLPPGKWPATIDFEGVTYEICRRGVYDSEGDLQYMPYLAANCDSLRVYND